MIDISLNRKSNLDLELYINIIIQVVVQGWEGRVRFNVRGALKGTAAKPKPAIDIEAVPCL